MSQPVLGDSDAGPRWFVYVCPYCGQQYRGPSGHHVAGDDRATSCFHAHEGERGITQPKLVRVEVEPIEHWEPRSVPHDTPLGRTYDAEALDA
jgi:hypothetical protein